MSTDLTTLDDEGYLDLAHLSPMICAELAAGLADKDAIKEKYSISDAQWERLRQNPSFRKMMKDAMEVFSGDMNAGKRITVKSEIALEDSLPRLHVLANSAGVPPAINIDAMKLLGVLANRGKNVTEGGAAGGGFNVQIHINTGDDRGVIIEGTKVSES